MDQVNLNVLGDRIKYTLKKNNKSQAELAKVLKKSPAYISNILKGRYLPKLEELIRIAHYFGKPVNFFLSEEVERLSYYIEKAEKWDKIVELLDRKIQKELIENIISIPVVLGETKLVVPFQKILTLRNRATQFVHISREFFEQNLKYKNDLEKLFALRIFTQDYPEFDVKVGDIIIIEPFQKEDFDEHSSGKVFVVLYHNKIGFKRIFLKNKNKFYLEPVNTTPIVPQIPIDDPDLQIIGKFLFNINFKFY